MLFILTGNGKGKTTCAVGMGMRAVGAGRQVLMVQFLKSGKSSENKALAGNKNFTVKSFGRDVCISKSNVSQKDFVLAQQGFEFAKKTLAARKSAFLILDEICIALHFGLLDVDEVATSLRAATSLRGAKRRSNPDIVLTGRYCPKQVIKIADLITEFKEIKHYFQKGKRARKGIEY